MYMYMYSPLFVFSEKRIVMASPTSYAGSLSSGSEAITDTTLIFSEPKDPSSTWHNNSQVNATVIVHGQLSGERRCFETFYRAHHIGRCSTPQHTATHCNTLQHTLQRICLRCCTGLIMSDGSLLPSDTATHCSTLQHAATHCNTQQHTATYPFETLYRAYHVRWLTLRGHCSTLQHTAAHYSTLQHTATHCNTLQRTATYPFETLYRTHHFRWLTLAVGRTNGTVWQRPHHESTHVWWTLGFYCCCAASCVQHTDFKHRACGCVCVREREGESREGGCVCVHEYVCVCV